MAWWLFKKRDEEAHNRIDQLHEAIQKSFLNIKKDIENIHQNHSEKSTSLHERLLALEQKIGQMVYSFSDEADSGEAIQVKNQDVLEDLTQTQKTIFLTVYEMEKQLGRDISIRSLAEILYKGKEYDSVRAMLSRFITELTKIKLVKKSKEGKQVYVSITQQGSRIARQAISEDKRKRK